VPKDRYGKMNSKAPADRTQVRKSKNVFNRAVTFYGLIRQLLIANLSQLLT